MVGANGAQEIFHEQGKYTRGRSSGRISGIRPGWSHFLPMIHGNNWNHNPGRSTAKGVDLYGELKSLSARREKRLRIRHGTPAFIFVPARPGLPPDTANQRVSNNSPSGERFALIFLCIGRFHPIGERTGPLCHPIQH